MGAHRYLTGDSIIHDGARWFLIWPKGRTPDGEMIWEAENELGETKWIYLR